MGSDLVIWLAPDGDGPLSSIDDALAPSSSASRTRIVSDQAKMVRHNRTVGPISSMARGAMPSARIRRDACMRFQRGASARSRGHPSPRALKSCCFCRMFRCGYRAMVAPTRLGGENGQDSATGDHGRNAGCSRWVSVPFEPKNLCDAALRPDGSDPATWDGLCRTSVSGCDEHPVQRMTVRGRSFLCAPALHASCTRPSAAF